MTDRACSRCGGSLRGSPRRRYCSEACRQAAYRTRQRSGPVRLQVVGEPREALGECAHRLALAANALATHLDQHRLGPESIAGSARHTAAVAGFRRLVEDMITLAVLADRSAGLRWEALGDALGVSGEVARVRYGRLRATDLPGSALRGDRELEPTGG